MAEWRYIAALWVRPEDGLEYSQEIMTNDDRGLLVVAQEAVDASDLPGFVMMAAEVNYDSTDGLCRLVGGVELTFPPDPAAA